MTREAPARKPVTSRAADREAATRALAIAAGLVVTLGVRHRDHAAEEAGRVMEALCWALDLAEGSGNPGLCSRLAATLADCSTAICRAVDMAPATVLTPRTYGKGRTRGARPYSRQAEQLHTLVLHAMTDQPRITPVELAHVIQTGHVMFHCEGFLGVDGTRDERVTRWAIVIGVAIKRFAIDGPDVLARQIVNACARKEGFARPSELWTAKGRRGATTRRRGPA